MLKEGHILWALRSRTASGDSSAAYSLLVAMSDASEGILTTFNPDIKLKGAVNRNAVTCYLDSTLFSMFSRLDSFEAMLYNSFEDVKKERLAFLLRLWVNLLRSGQLIAIDITREIQDALAACGWAEAREMHQQDASEAFTFITEKLNLPLLTLKMDIYHTGKHDNDDHRFINERLLEVAIPTLADGEHPKDIKLEDCLEEYFNNRIEVKRYLERRNTLQSTKSHDSRAKEMGLSVHVETVEVDPDISTPLTPLSPMPSYMADRPVNRNRAPSIIQERYIPDKQELSSSPMDNPKAPLGRLRTGSVRKEVLMPAWQFFSLIPWYTDNAPSNDAQVAAHFSSKRPVLGLCLKRYSYTNSGRAVRLNTFVDIPIEIGLPHFIQDDNMHEDAPLYGNFKLSLQSVVCHRGNSVDSGHYISLVRTTTPARGSDQEEMTHWVRFDDLAAQRVSLVDIQKALREETPYLLFYQIQPVEGDPGNVTSGENPPPAYTITDTSKTETSNSGDLSEKTNSAEDQPSSGRASTELTSPIDVRDASPDFPAQRRPSAVSFSEYLPQPSRTSSEANRDSALIVEHKKTPSFNNGLSKTFSKLGVRHKKSSKEDISTDSNVPNSDPTAPEHSGPEIHVEQVSGLDVPDGSVLDPARNKSEPGLTSPGRGAMAMAMSGAAPTLGRSLSKREKSRSRKLRSGKGKLEDSDRECVVM